MKNLFFTSDHHFGHKNIIKFSNRPFENADEMDEIMIQRWNEKIKPDEIYHFGSQSFINYDFDSEFFNLNPSINGTNFLLTAIKKFSPKTKFYFAASSEIFGNPKKSPQNENTQLY